MCLSLEYFMAVADVEATGEGVEIGAETYALQVVNKSGGIGVGCD